MSTQQKSLFISTPDLNLMLHTIDLAQSGKIEKVFTKAGKIFVRKLDE